MQRVLGLNVRGVDLSDEMLEHAQSLTAGSLDIAFSRGDARELPHVVPAGREYAATTMTLAAHHFESPQALCAVLEAMHEVTRDSGVVCIMDVRLKTRQMVERYYDLTGVDYQAHGKMALYEDGKNSLLAAFTPEELAQAVPHTPGRCWYLFVSPLFRAVQILLGIPKTQLRPFVRRLPKVLRAALPIPPALQTHGRSGRFFLFLKAKEIRSTAKRSAANTKALQNQRIAV